MSKRIVRFSRLLRIFELNDNPAFIIELEENNQKNLYISYLDKESFSKFESYNESTLKKEFKGLSNNCLMSVCTDASYMFNDSPLTHFEADCSSLVYANSMFYNSHLCFINTKFPLLEHAEDMFSHTKIKEIMIDFPKLINGSDMFYGSTLKKITSKFPMLENGLDMFHNTKIKTITINFPKLKNGSYMFYNSPLEKITSQFPLLENEEWMFKNTPSELKQNYPQYFV